ncbi:Mitochondrial ribosome-associated GTPase 2 [Acipenser ruthenus]|uniref:Mitochondrial ribosome-associated GTPase 2 n=1 Tax=Acipenser ruthenus TaxID=7906 RepID=A0A662YJX2_ACIRT|nr:Mitochondrial ribosome-associated GTPase 2 [Acipenser ruthenus]
MLAPHALFLRRWLLQEGTRLFRRKASGSMVLTATLRLPSHANIERDLVRTSNVEYFSTSCVNCAKSRELKGKRDISEKKLTRYFVDHRRVSLTGGKGGKGASTFHSEPRKEFGGPDGGNGGDGGTIIIKVDQQIKSLSLVEPLYRGMDGESGGSKNCYGRNAAHTYIRVPLGTIVKEDGTVVADLSKHGQEYVAAFGGTGGKGNRFFLSNENRAPTKATPGEHGQERVGFPNAGKSSLLRAISNAKPAVAAYPFTTLNPHVGIVQYQDHEQVAGAHRNRGLGISFLRHIERCRFLLFVLDLSGPDPWAQLQDLRFELEQYETGLSKRPQAIVGNKIDLPEARANLSALQSRVPQRIIPVSALTGHNVEELILHLRELYDGYLQTEESAGGQPVSRLMMLAPHALFLRRWLLQEGTRLFRRKASGSMVLTATLRLPSHANIERDLVRTSNVEYFSTSCVNCAKSRELKGKRDISEKKLTRYFVDHRRVSLTGGKGGKGASTFHSEPRKEFGGPDGGNGGDGGTIIIKVDQQIKSLSLVEPLYHGMDGESGGSKNCYGRNAAHTYIRVPLGTIVKEDGTVVADLSKHGQEYVAAFGGTGGKGNRFFLSNENRAPTKATPGEHGQERVGFPNAGKSSLLRAISNAKPAVAAYPFTTLNPHVGIVQYQDHEQVAVADIPGIIQGAHRNRGLGISFLRHIERCRFLLFVLDLSGPDPWAQLQDLRFELEQYETGLSKRPQAIVGNKIDLPEARANLSALQSRVPQRIIPVSALTGHNVEELILHLRELYDGYLQTEESAGGQPVRW